MPRITVACGALAPGIGLATAPSALAAYPNCTAAHADDRYDIPKGDPDYASKQDRHGDGVACES